VSDYCVMKNDDDAIKVGTMQNPKIDEILKIKPDVVITNAPLTGADTNKLYQGDIDIVVVPVATSVEGMWQQYDTLGTLYSGKVTGVVRAMTKYEPYKEKLDAMSKQNAEKSDEKTKGLLIAKKDFAIATGDTLLGNLLEHIGIDNIAKSGEKFGASTNDLSSAQVIFIADDIDIADINSDEKLKNSPAVKNKMVFQIDVDGLLRGGFNSINILEEMSSLVFGEDKADENTEKSEENQKTQ
ncbi:MAG: ABC transporter substrate-binding protein, partial [Oscillospiraceae bacterium]